MFTRTFSIALIAAVALSLATACQLYAVPTLVQHQDVTPHCDPLFIPKVVDEIGDFTIFPADEALAHTDLGFALPVCTPVDNPNVADRRVEIVNGSGRSFDEVWYVANRETDISNFDGFANDLAFPGGHEAFRIDNDISDPFGSHHPLLLESIAANGIWEAGERWEFVLQDYFNALGLPPDLITSFGIGDASGALGAVPSSGSIIAIPSIVPEPSSAMMALIAMVGIAVITLRQRG